MTDATMPLATAPAGPPHPDAADELEELLYVITHDMRAGFRAFKTLPDWIAEDLSPLPPDRQALLDGHIAMLRTQADRCDRMLIDLRDYSRVGRCADATAPHDLQEILSSASTAIALPDRFVLQCDAGATLLGPWNELCQLFGALLSNAVKHHDRDSGGIQVSVSSAGPMLRILVADDGPGIPGKFHDAVFDLLRTLRPRDACEGSGMGLSIARKIANRLGGSISILDTGSGRGTTVALELPGITGDRPDTRPH